MELDDKVSASSDHGTVLLTVDATAASPGQAALLSESVANNLTKTITDLESRHGKAQSGIRLAVANDAIVPVSPDGPAWWLYVTIGMLLGAALGIAGALFRSAVDSKIREISGIREITNAPILGSLPMHSDSSSRTGLPALRQDTPYDEAIRRLRTNLRFVRVEDSSNILAVTSSIPSEGKTSTCIELAVSLAQSGQRVALVDVDLRQPAVADRLGLENSAGLTTALVGAADVHDLLQPWGQDELYVLTAGDSVANPVELIESRAMAKLMAVLGNDFDTVLLDCPPVLPVTDGLLLAKSAGRIVHVVAVNQASRNELDEALQDLSVVDTPLSLVVNKVPRPCRPQRIHSVLYFGSAGTNGRAAAGAVRRPVGARAYDSCGANSFRQLDVGSARLGFHGSYSPEVARNRTRVRTTARRNGQPALSDACEKTRQTSEASVRPEHRS